MFSFTAGICFDSRMSWMFAPGSGRLRASVTLSRHRDWNLMTCHRGDGPQGSLTLRRLRGLIRQNP
jgi:hypothetical protein